MQFPRKARRSPTLNIIPLIDVLVVLLIFYIATTVFKKTERVLNIVVPKTSHASTAQGAAPTTIYVTEDSKMYLDDTPVEPEHLAELLKSKLAADPNFKVAMKLDAKAPFQMIVKVWDAARDAGIPDIPTYAAPTTPAATTP